jgi:pilus assembly protein CpaE
MRVVIARQAGVLRDRLRQSVLGLGLKCDAFDCVSYDELPARLVRGEVDLVLVGLGTDFGRGLKVLEKTYQQTEAPIFAVGLSSDSGHILQTIRSGAREHLHEEDVREELLAAIGKLRQAGTVAPRWGRIIGVAGAQGGVGVTTVASNVSFALAGVYPGQVVLAEMGAGVPELALNLDLDPPHGLDALAAAWERMDTTLLRKAIVEHPANLSVLAHPPETLQAVGLEPLTIKNIAVLLRSMFQFAVLDLGHTFDPARREALQLVDKLVVVLRLDVPSLRLSRRLIQMIVELGVAQEKLHIIVNRFGQREQFSWKRAQQAIGLTVAEWIPDDPARVNKAVNQGQPLVRVARGAPITKRFASLAMQLNGIAKH